MIASALSLFAQLRYLRFFLDTGSIFSPQISKGASSSSIAGHAPSNRYFRVTGQFGATVHRGPHHTDIMTASKQNVIVYVTYLIKTVATPIDVSASESNA
jgi:hypothetical protein